MDNDANDRAMAHATEMERRKLWATAFHNAYEVDNTSTADSIKTADDALTAMDKAFAKPTTE